MIRVMAMYGSGEGITFDADYWKTVHMPLVKQHLGDALVKWEADLAAPTMDGSTPQYLAVAHMYFDSMESFGAAMAANGGPVMADVPNYYNGQPTLVINEVAANG